MIIMPNSGAKSATYCTLGCEAEKKQCHNNANSTDIWLHKNIRQVQRRESIHQILYFSV